MRDKRFSAEIVVESPLVSGVCVSAYDDSAFDFAGRFFDCHHVEGFALWEERINDLAIQHELQNHYFHADCDENEREHGHKKRCDERSENERHRDVNPAHKRERMYVVFFGGHGVGVGSDFLCHIVDSVFFALTSAIAFAESGRNVRDKVKHIVCALPFVLLESFEFHNFLTSHVRYS